MASMMIQQRVKDFGEWKKVYDSFAEKRLSNGAQGAHVYKDADDPGKVVIFGDWNSLEEAHKWAASPDLKAAMEKAGVVGPPVFSYLNEA